MSLYRMGKPFSGEACRCYFEKAAKAESSPANGCIYRAVQASWKGWILTDDSLFRRRGVMFAKGNQDGPWVSFVDVSFSPPWSPPGRTVIFGHKMTAAGTCKSCKDVPSCRPANHRRCLDNFSLLRSGKLSDDPIGFAR